MATPKPDNCGIEVETRGDLLRITIPGRWTEEFWMVITLGSLVMIIAWGVLFAMYRVDHTETIYVAWYYSSGYLLVGLWMIYRCKARREIIEYDRQTIRTHGGRVPLFARRTMSAAAIGGFCLTETKMKHGFRSDFPAPYGFAPEYKTLYATSERLTPRTDTPGRPRDDMRAALDELSDYLTWLMTWPRVRFLPLAIQARQKDLPWLRDLLAEHLDKLKALGGNPGLSEGKRRNGPDGD
jgi:hypothetical protein